MTQLTVLENKRIVVLGLGLTGMSFVRFLAAQQLSFAVNDSREQPLDVAQFVKDYPQAQISVGGWDSELISQAEILLVSPGVDLNQPAIAEQISEHCLVMGDVELYCRLVDTPMVAVTGSNGKSTVVSLLHHIGQALGVNTQLGGNVGVPVLDTLGNLPELMILELSSFQLETLSSMNAIAGCVLNVSDDHLDRHLTLENYRDIKHRIYHQCHTAIFNRDDLLTMPSEAVNVARQSFGRHAANDAVDYFAITELAGEQWLVKGEQRLIKLSQLPIAGVHNALNCLAALAIGECAGWSLDKMVNALPSFVGLAHRCQPVASNDDKTWINDSKATNVGATLAAIEGIAPTLSSSQRLFLIAGGEGKGADFSPLSAPIKQYVSHVFALGKDAAKILSVSASGQQVDTLDEAVNCANQQSVAGDIILLSPACASIDMFQNYIARGDAFIAAVSKLKEAS